MISYRHLLTNKLKIASLAFVCASSCLLQHNLCAMQNQPETSFVDKLKGLCTLVFIAPIDIDPYTTEDIIKEKKLNPSKVLVVKGPDAPQKTSHKNGHADIKICFLNNQNKKISMAKNKLNTKLKNKMLASSYLFLYNLPNTFKGNREFNEKLYTLIEEIIFKPSTANKKESKFFEWYKIAHHLIKNNPYIVKKIENYFISILMNFIYMTPNNNIQTIWNQLPENKIKKIISFFYIVKNDGANVLENSNTDNFRELYSKCMCYNNTPNPNDPLHLTAQSNFAGKNINLALMLLPYALTKKNISQIATVNFNFNSFTEIPRGLRNLPNVRNVTMNINNNLSSLNNLKVLKIDTLDIHHSNYFSLFQILRPSNKTNIIGIKTNFTRYLTTSWSNKTRLKCFIIGVTNLLMYIKKIRDIIPTGLREPIVIVGISAIALLCASFVTEVGEILSHISTSIKQTMQEFKHRNDKLPEDELLAND